MNDTEFNALRDQMSECRMLLPESEEYKNDCPQPNVSAAPSQSTSTTLAKTKQDPPPKAEDPLAQKDWDKLDSMVASTHALLKQILYI